MSDLVEILRNYIPGENDDYVPMRTKEAADEIERLRAQLASARKAVEEMESYRLALAWIEGQSTDPKAREIATDALQCAETDDQGNSK